MSYAAIPDTVPQHDELPADAAVALIGVLDDLVRAQHTTHSRLAAEHGLTSAGLGMLRRLHREGPLRLADLAARLRVDDSVASRQAAALVRAGLLHRAFDPNDRRARVLELTDVGEEIVTQCLRRLAEAVIVAIEDSDDDAVTQTLHQLSEVTSALDTP